MATFAKLSKSALVAGKHDKPMTVKNPRKEGRHPHHHHLHCSSPGAMLERDGAACPTPLPFIHPHLHCCPPIIGQPSMQDLPALKQAHLQRDADQREAGVTQCLQEIQGGAIRIVAHFGARGQRAPVAHACAAQSTQMEQRDMLTCQ
eukprot:1158975-Pelagomonas_calceolata.AAC.24